MSSSRDQFEQDMADYSGAYSSYMQADSNMEDNVAPEQLDADFDDSQVIVHTQKPALRRSSPYLPLIVTPGELITERADNVLRYVFFKFFFFFSFLISYNKQWPRYLCAKRKALQLRLWCR